MGPFISDLRTKLVAFGTVDEPLASCVMVHFWVGVDVLSWYSGGDRSFSFLILELLYIAQVLVGMALLHFNGWFNVFLWWLQWKTGCTLQAAHLIVQIFNNRTTVEKQYGGLSNEGWLKTYCLLADAQKSLKKIISNYGFWHHNGNKPLPEPRLTQICVATWHLWATLS